MKSWKYWEQAIIQSGESVAPSCDKKRQAADTSLLDPTTWMVDQVGLDRPGISISKWTNVPLYPEFQAFFRMFQPPTLIVWGKNDFIFPAEGAPPYIRDLKNLETHMLDTGHFALETHGEEIAARIEEFLLKQNLKR